MKDPIVTEVRKARDAHARRFGYDLHAICVDVRRREKRHADRLVSLPPRRKLPQTGS